MHNKRLSKTPSSINSNSQAAEQNPKLAYRPFGSQIQKASAAPVTQTTKEDVAFAEQKMEAFGLELQAKYGKITPEGQERLTVLQAKMANFSSSQLEHARRYSHNIANIPLRRPDTPTPIQAKLTIGEPGDKYEQEADKIADKVVERIHQPQSKKLQRESLPDDQEELQMKLMVQRRASNGGVAATEDFEAALNQTLGGGRPMEKNYREKMEQGFGGADFSEMKIHTDSQADQLSRSIGALAFTHKNHVYFRGGTYNPGTKEGDRLVGHEFTHGLQNGGAVQRVTDVGRGRIVQRGQNHSSQIADPSEDRIEVNGDDFNKYMELVSINGTARAMNANTEGTLGHYFKVTFRVRNKSQKVVKFKNLPKIEWYETIQKETDDRGNPKMELEIRKDMYKDKPDSFTFKSWGYGWDTDYAPGEERDIVIVDKPGLGGVGGDMRRTLRREVWFDIGMLGLPERLKATQELAMVDGNVEKQNFTM